MLKSVLSVAVFSAAMLAGVRPVLGHHAFAAEFDAEKPIKLQGNVTKVEWINPHSWIYIDVKEPDGTMTNWAVEAGAPNALFRRGWKRDALTVGTVIVVEGFRAKNGKNVSNGRQVTFQDGKQLFIGSSETGAPG